MQVRQLSGDVTVLGAAASTAACSEIYAAFVPKGDSWRKEALKHSEIDLDVRCKTDDDFESGTAPLELHVRCPPATTPVEESMRKDGTAVHPFHSLHAARDAIREMPESLRAAGVRVTIHLEGGHEPLVARRVARDEVDVGDAQARALQLKQRILTELQ